MQHTNGQTITAQLDAAAHVWLLRPETVTGAELLAECTALLSEDETVRYHRYRFEQDRHLYLVAHAMLRRVLSNYVDIDPSAWRFIRNPHGRPEIAAPDIPLALRFNLSHTRGLVACLVTLADDCGVDAERVAVRRHIRGIAEKMFAPAEQAALQPLDGQDYLQRFFTYWTLREAYSKACGTGLARSGKHYFFTAGAARGWEINCSDRPEITAHWQLDVRQPVTNHIVALAIHTPDGEQRTISYRDFEF
jgi:4'-phosphopantetheinyl transferase